MFQFDALMPIVDESRKGASVRPDQTLGQALLAARLLYGGRGISAVDASGRLSMGRLVAQAGLLSRLMERQTNGQRRG